MAVIPEAMSSLSQVSDRYYWRGAYGPIMMPQIAKCIVLLRAHPYTRRAGVSMLDGRPHNANRPACISFLQFINQRDELHLVATQRALRLDLMPHDCIILTEVLRYVSRAIGVPAGKLHWHVGSLHATNSSTWDTYSPDCTRNVGIHIDTNTPWEDLCSLLK